MLLLITSPQSYALVLPHFTEPIVILCDTGAYPIPFLGTYLRPPLLLKLLENLSFNNGPRSPQKTATKETMSERKPPVFDRSAKKVHTYLAKLSTVYSCVFLT
jgi:hypothetical protein